MHPFRNDSGRRWEGGIYAQMARTKRNNPDAAACLYNMEEKRIAAAIYARLSVKDNGDGKEAMRTQVEYLQRFLSGRKDLKLAGIYQDNGRTGTDFVEVR